MSQTLAWILSLLALVALCVACVGLHAPAIEAELSGRLGVDVPGVVRALDGRDVTLTGTVPTAQASADAEAAARRIRGVRSVHNDLEIAGDGAEAGALGAGEGSGASVPPFALSEAGGALVARGVVPNGAVRTSLLARIRDAYPGREIRDELTIEAGVSGDWEASLLALIGRLGGIARPSVAIEPGDDGGGVVVLGGAVPTDDDKAETERRARAAIAAPYTLRSELIVEDPTIGDQLQNSGSTDADVVAAEDAFREALALGQIQFASGTDDLTPQSRQILDRVAAVLVRFPSVAAEVQGHTDAQGGDAANLTLSQQRAEAVQAYLAEQGAEADALTPRGYGEAQPVASNDTPEGRARNRRVVFALSTR